MCLNQDESDAWKTILTLKMDGTQVESQPYLPWRMGMFQMFKNSLGLVQWPSG